ncbi:MAG: hypothetical protein ACLQB4_05945 [Beijerinckiaceae bacterium]
MEKNNDARIADLEAKFATLQALVSQEAERSSSTWKLLLLNDERGEILARHDKNHFEMLGHAKAMIDAHTDLIESLRLDMMQMRDAYYQVFPGRLEQDARLGRQLGALASKQVPDTDPKTA